MTLYQIKGFRDISFQIFYHHLSDDKTKPHHLMIEWWFTGKFKSFKLDYGLQTISLSDEQWESRKDLEADEE